MSPKPKFVEGEKVLCFHGPLIYEAKALKSMVTKDKQVKYYIHYAGWNKNWDEWVPETRVLKYNEANVQKQKEVFKQHSSTARKSKKSSSKAKKADTSASTTKDSGASSGGSESRASTPPKESISGAANRSNRSKQSTNTSSTADSSLNKKDDAKVGDSLKDDKEEPLGKKKRSGSNTSKSAGTGINTGADASACVGTTISSNSNKTLDSCVENEESFLSKIEVKIKFPDDLKQCLADDWDAITRQHKLLDIPAKITVQDIVDQYITFKKAAKSTSTSKEFAITDVLNGVVEYFNVILGSQLLYKFERPQYAEILQQHPDTPLSNLYGAFHLLRLFVKLGPMLAFSTLDDKSMHTLLMHLHDLLKFLVKNSATYFSMTNFVNVSPEYHRNTQ